MKKRSQADLILDYLSENKRNRLNAMDALSWFGCSRLAARIYDLRSRGYEFHERTYKVNGKRFTSYQLAR